MPISFKPEPIRAIATQLPNGHWFVRCCCPAQGTWGWDRLPNARVVACPCDGCPFLVRVMAVMRVVIRRDDEP